MLYNTGTIAINGNTATGTGTNWTAPASQVRTGQTIIVMSNPVQLFQISSVNSATSMTVTPAASPALSGQKYGILVSDIISVDGLAQAMSQLINEYDENISAWETFATTSANQSITVTINGASVIIPGIGGLARKGANSDISELKGLTTALSVAQGGTGAKNAADARTNFGLGTAALKNNVNGTLGDVMLQGYGNLVKIQQYNPGLPLGQTGVYGQSSASGWKPSTAGSGFITAYSDDRRQQYWITIDGQFYVRHIADAAFDVGANVYPWTQMQSVGTSDIDFKEDITELDTDVALANIDAMEFVSFRYKNDDSGVVRRGVIAQQIEKIDPEYVHSAEGVGKMTLDLNPLLMDALAAIKALNARVEDLSQQIEALKS